MEQDKTNQPENTNPTPATSNRPYRDSQRAFTEFLNSIGMTESKVQERRQRAISVKLRSL